MKTKLFTLLLAVAASVGTVFSAVEIDGINYNLDDANLTAEVTSGNGYSGSIVIPSSVISNAKSYSVTSIGYDAFYYCTGLTSVTIPNSITSIGSWAFQYCRGLTSVTIPNSVTSIGSWAFYGCSGLTSVTIPNSVTSIGESAFKGCTGLTSFEIPNSVTTIGGSAFADCTGLTSVTIHSNAIMGQHYTYDYSMKNIFGEQVKKYIIGNDVTSIGDYVFYDCSGLTSMTIGNNVTTIGNSAFNSCTGLTSVTIPNSVTSIGESAFYHCTGLTSVEIPNSVTSIGSYTFTGCTGLTSVTIGNSITSIGEHAFENCIGLTSIEIPNSVTSIGFNAFKGCSNLSIVTCHAATPPSCNSKAFENCSSKTLYVKETSISAYKAANIWKTFGTILAIKTAIGDLYYNLNEQSRTATVTSSLEGKYSGNIVIPASVSHNNITYSVTSIGSSAFEDCTGLTSVEIPNSVTSIGESAFNGCTGLTSVTIPNSVTSIGQNAFKDCNNLSIYVSCGDLDRIKYMLNNDSRVKYKPIPYSITTNATNGTVSSSQKDCDELELSAIPNEGYHFVQWSDGNTSNPRTIHVTQDMTFTAEFAKNTYTVTTVSNNPEWGTTNGNHSAIYLDRVEISATSNHGYHFEEWILDVPSIQLDAITVSQAYDIAAGLANGATTSSKYTIVGYVTSEYRTYTNSYYLSDSPDEPGNFVVFRCASFANIGDRVMVKGYLTNYQGTTPETTQGSSLSVLQKYKDNPWSFAVKNDMTIIARFAKNTYTVSGQYDKKMGSIEGLGKYEYLDAVKLSPIPNYGYHFAQWSDGNTDNPRTIILTQDTMISAIFKPNPKITYSCNSEYGHIIGDTITPTGVAVDTITFEAISNYGYHFTQWSDGNKENPRSIILTQDTVMAAEFAIDKSGTCGKDNALTWSYEDQSKTLTITGNGELTENYTFGLEAPTQMVTLIIGNGVTAIGDSAFYGMSTINHLIIGGSVATIRNYAFAECRNFDDITCYATTVPIINETTFANVGNKQYIYLFVPAERERAYYRDTYWGEFDIQVQQAEETTVTTNDVTVEPQDNAATVTWPTVENANTYEIVITKDGEVFCVLTFNANGQLAGIAFAPGRNEANHTQQSQKTGFKFTVTGLNSGTQYGYSIDSKNQGGSTIDSKTGTFTTTMEGESITSEGFEDVLSTEKVHKILRDGQIYILRGEKVYTVTGQEVR